MHFVFSHSIYILRFIFFCALPPSTKFVRDKINSNNNTINEIQMQMLSQEELVLRGELTLMH